jgi:hypothetical protein
VRTSTVVPATESDDWVSLDGVEVVDAGVDDSGVDVGAGVDVLPVGEESPDTAPGDPPDDGADAGAGAGCTADVSTGVEVTVGVEGVEVTVGVEGVEVTVGVEGVEVTVDVEGVTVGVVDVVGDDVGPGAASRGCSRGAWLTGPAVVPGAGAGVDSSSALEAVADSDCGVAFGVGCSDSAPAHPAVRRTRTSAADTNTCRLSLRTLSSHGPPAISVR